MKASSIHPIDWTEEKITRFWNYYAGIPVFDYQHFGNQRGRSLVRYARKQVALSEDVLDVGCGMGFIIGHMLNGGISCEGVDIAEDSVAAVNAKVSPARSHSFVLMTLAPP